MILRRNNIKGTRDRKERGGFKPIVVARRAPSVTERPPA